MIGENIKTHRKALGITQAQLAERVGVSKYAVFSYENDRMKPTGERAKKLAEALGISLNELLADQKENNMGEVLDWAYQRGFEKGYEAGLSDGRKEGLPFA